MYGPTQNLDPKCSAVSLTFIRYKRTDRKAFPWVLILRLQSAASMFVAKYTVWIFWDFSCCQIRPFLGKVNEFFRVVKIMDEFDLNKIKILKILDLIYFRLTLFSTGPRKQRWKLVWLLQRGKLETGSSLKGSVRLILS